MSSSAAQAPTGGLVPAQLGFLAIFNPSLGNTDETVDDHIVYYACVPGQQPQRRPRRARSGPADAVSCHERLRQIGLAQAMASFGRGFADGAAVDAVETQTSRVVMHELELSWWILASIDLERVPFPPRLSARPGQVGEAKFECTTRELKPASLLLRDLLRAHETFLMHHDSSLSALFIHCRRSKFVALMGRYWDLFLSTWNVMLHGNPARDMFGGINLAASGELGVSVGEEDRGSGEREVLEGLVGRIEGLVDLVVSKFGGEEAPPSPRSAATAKPPPHGDREPWLGTGREPAADDGAIFLGTGALSRNSLRDVTHWMEDLYTWGEHAYGLIESPTSLRRAKATKAAKPAAATPAPGSPADGVQRAASSRPPPQATGGAGDDDAADDVGAAKPGDAEDGRLDGMLSYMKLGYGSYWTLPGDSSASVRARMPGPGRERGLVEPPGAGSTASQEASGHFLIGLRGDIEESPEAGPGSASGSDSEAEHNSRTVVRTLHVELESGAAGRRAEATVVKDFGHPGNVLPGYNSHEVNKAHKLRVVVYVNRPFVFLFLFGLRTDSLAWDALYRSLHYQLAPLKRSLLASTRRRSDAVAALAGVHSVAWDPASLTVRSTVPGIPADAGGDAAAAWSRADAVSTHLHLLHLHGPTRALAGDVERTLKTSRGWWVVWTRLLDASPSPPGSAAQRRPRAGGAGSDNGADADRDAYHEARAAAKEIFLVRRSSDHAGLCGGAAGADSSLAHGLGVDTRRYIEELLSFL